MQSITRDELEAMNAKKHDFVLINVLPQESFNRQHIRTSINLPGEDEHFVDYVAMVAGNKNREIIVYCASFDCNASPKAAEKLEKAGFTKIYDYEGGTKDWFENKKAA